MKRNRRNQRHSQNHWAEVLRRKFSPLTFLQRHAQVALDSLGRLYRNSVTSLMTAAVADNDFTLVTIFVNPLQFAAGEDLESYPRDLERDLDICAAEGVDLVLSPPVQELYPTAI